MEGIADSTDMSLSKLWEWVMDRETRHAAAHRKPPVKYFLTDGETVATVTDFISLGSKIAADGDRSHEIK